MIGETKVSIYEDIFDTTSQYKITVADALMRIKKGRSAKAVISIRNETDKPRQDNLKCHLPSVTFSGVFSERLDEKITSHSGLICLDFDEVDILVYKNKMISLPYCLAAWDSPRGTGIKALVRIANGKKHREHFAALLKYFPDCDRKCANESRVTYESYDENIYINWDCTAFTECIKYEVVSFKNNISIESHEVMAKLSKWCESKGGFFQGNRNSSAFILAGAFCRFGVNLEDATNYIVSNYSNPKDFTSKEIEKTCRSAYKKNKNNFASADFSNEKLVAKETTYEISPDILLDGFKPEDVIYGTDVYDKAVSIYEHGYKSAETTHIPMLDKHFKFKRGELTLLTGIGNYGKSTYFYQLMLIRALFDGNKWGIFSPENNPAEEFYFDLTEMLLGCRCDGAYSDKPPKKIFDEAYRFISDHFYYIYPESIMPSPEFIKVKFMELILKEKISGVVIDPFNQLTNDYKTTGGRTDKYLETFLSDCLRFGVVNNVFFLLIAHPHKLNKGGATDYPCPDVFEIADGAMWNNKCDNILVYHRPFGQSSPMDATCEHHSKKIRRQKIIGEKGSFEFTYERKRRRFYFDGFNPLDGNKFEWGGKRQTEMRMEPNYNADKFHESKSVNESEEVPF